MNPLKVFLNSRNAKGNGNRNADVELVRQYLEGRLQNSGGVTAAGRRLLPTGNWLCMRCASTWKASGVVPIEWWKPENNNQKQAEMPPWQCRQGACATYAYTIPIP